MNLFQNNIMQFSLRSVLLVMTFVAVILGGFAAYRNHINHYDSLKKVLEDQGFRFRHQAETGLWSKYLYGKSYRGKLIEFYGPIDTPTAKQVSSTRPIMREVLRNSEALETFECGRFPFNDDDMSCLSGLSHLRRLKLEGAPISDEGLVHLRLVQANLELDLDRTKITDEGILFLEKGEYLQLTFRDTNITDESLRILRRTSINFLDIESTQISSDGIEYLVEIPHLHTVLLYGNQVSIQAISDIQSRKPKLNILYKHSLGYFD